MFQFKLVLNFKSQSKFLYLVFYIFVGIPITNQPVYAEIHHWVDQYGQSHFGDKPPDLEADVISYDRMDEIELENLVDTVPTEKIPIANPLENRRSSTLLSKNRRYLKSEQIERQCASLREQLKKIQYDLRLGYKEPKGNRLRQKRRSLTGKLHKNCS